MPYNYQNPFNFSYPGFGGGFGQQQPQSNWSWGGQGQQQNQLGNFNPNALSGFNPQQSPGTGGGGPQTGGPSYYGNPYGPYGPYYGGGGYGPGYPYSPYGGGGGYSGNPLQRGGTGTTPSTGTPPPSGGGGGQFGPFPPSTGTPTNPLNPETTGQMAATGYVPTGYTGTEWGQSGGTPNLLAPQTASMLGYGTMPPGMRGFNLNTMAWE